MKFKYEIVLFLIAILVSAVAVNPTYATAIGIVALCTSLCALAYVEREKKSELEEMRVLVAALKSKVDTVIVGRSIR